MRDSASETVLKEASVYREMVRVLLETLHEAVKREKNRKERLYDDNANR